MTHKVTLEGMIRSQRKLSDERLNDLRELVKTHEKELLKMYHELQDGSKGNHAAYVNHSFLQDMVEMRYLVWKLFDGGAAYDSNAIPYPGAYINRLQNQINGHIFEYEWKTWPRTTNQLI